MLKFMLPARTLTSASGGSMTERGLSAEIRRGACAEGGVTDMCE